MYSRKFEGLAAVGASVLLSEDEEEEKSSANVCFLSALNSAYVLSVVCGSLHIEIEGKKNNYFQSTLVIGQHQKCWLSDINSHVPNEQRNYDINRSNHLQLAFCHW